MSTTMQPPADAAAQSQPARLEHGAITKAPTPLFAQDAATTRSQLQIIKAFYEYGVEPHRVAKLSGIGCSSKTPAYFLSQSHGFNGVHGRMPALATGVMLANQTAPRRSASAATETPLRSAWASLFTCCAAIFR